ncbi:peptide chain release factor N(5)-glutamine methyltransferase [Elusimicrobiota bacterium]
MNQSWTIGSTLDWTIDYFIKNSILEPQLEAELLLSSVLNCPRLNLHLEKNNIIPKEKLGIFKNYIIERKKRKPISYILGHKEFMGYRFKLNQHTLIPRPETEILVETALKIINTKKNVNLADICTGSGCIAISIAKLSAISKIYATDICDNALHVAFENINYHGLSGKIVLKKGDMFESLEGENIINGLDIIVSNPPYVAENEFDALEPELKHEPKIALYGGKDGLDFFKNLASNAKRYLKKGGFLIVEINSNKSKEIVKIFKSNNYKINKIIKDYSRLDRVIVAKL